MSRRWLTVVAVAVAGIVAGGAYWWANRPTPIPTRPSADAPKVGSCWRADAAATRTAFPWSAPRVACTEAHTIEIFYVGQVDHALIEKARGAKGSDVKVATNLMYAQARRACSVSASTYLGRDWHAEQVTVVADWIRPAEDGFFGCGLAQTSDPSGQRLVSRTGSAKGAAGELAIACVTRTGDALGYTPCDAEHDGEFVGVYVVTPPNAPFSAPGVTDAANRGCGQAVLAYLGLPSTGSRADLHVGYVGPTSAETWLGSDQTFGCYALADVKVRGTIRSLDSRPLPH